MTNENPLEKIIQEWESDAPIKPSQVETQSLETPRLHSKYLRILVTWKRKRTELSLKLNKVRQFKTRYYNGELSLDELKKHNLEQYQFKKPLKAELEALLLADQNVQEVQLQIESVETIIYALEKIIEQIKSRDFAISNHIKILAYNRGETF